MKTRQRYESGLTNDVRSNCIIWAVALYIRRKGWRRRSYIKWRMSDWGWFPHCLYEERHHTVSFKPVSPIKRAFPPPLFEGKVVWGDKRTS